MTRKQLSTFIQQCILEIKDISKEDKKIKQLKKKQLEDKKKKKTIKQGFDSNEGRQLDEIFEVIGGYNGFHQFIQDNPGCVQVIID